MIERIINRSLKIVRNLGEKPDVRLTNWIDIPAKLETPYGPVDGTVKYGIRKPIAPGNKPLTEVNPGSREEIDGERPAYWFVSPKQDIKVRLPVKKIKSANQEKVEGVGYDSSDKFEYMITKT